MKRYILTIKIHREVGRAKDLSAPRVQNAVFNGVANFVRRPARVITMAAPNNNDEL